VQDISIDLLFPSKAIDGLRYLRGENWKILINQVADLEPTNQDRIAFVLFMVRISGCTSCQSDSFRAMRGCGLCSTTTIKRFKGDDQTLIDLYNDARKDVVKYMIEV
jgi:hypothetical protein